MKNRLLPPNLFIICVALMCLIHYTSTTTIIFPYPVNLAGVAFLLPGLGLIFSSVYTLSRAETTFNTFKNPRKLVISGPFRHTRNPIYLGLLSVLIGIWFIMGTAFSVIGVILFFLVSNHWYIPYEEKTLSNYFGETYRDYRIRVRRWI